MCRILIVDDESLERDGIRFLIHRFGMPLEIFEAENGEDALIFLKANKVDILLTDIKMPFMNGIDLANEARKIDPALKIIIFSAYGEFDYAKRAIDIRVLHYLLKPVDMVEFQQVFATLLEQFHAEQKKRRSDLRERRLMGILHGHAAPSEMQESDHENKDIDLGLVLINISERFFDVFQEDFKVVLTAASNPYSGLKVDFLNLNEFQCALLMSQDTGITHETVELFASSLMSSLESFTTATVTMATSSRIPTLSSLQPEFLRLEDLLDYHLFHIGNLVIPAKMEINPSMRDNAQISAAAKLIGTRIKKGDLSGIAAGIRDFLACLNEAEVLSPILVKCACADLIMRIEEQLNAPSETDMGATIEHLFKCTRLSDLHQCMSEAMFILASDKESVQPEANKKVIDDIICDIRKNYMQDISLERIAGNVYLTPSYLSTLFKKETGSSLIKFVTACRMDKAKELLLHTNMRISDIGEAVGYPDKSYFSIVYRSFFGSSPVHYRENRGQ